MSSTSPAQTTNQFSDTVDAVVIGAGLSGIYQLYRLRKDGLNVRTFEAADGVGGVWFWNRYPGARVDSHFPHYQFFFSEELWNESEWTERFPAQPEIESYFNRVVDKFDLRRHISFGTRVTSTVYDEDAGHWVVETDRGDRVKAQFVIFNTGGLSHAKQPQFEGQELFQGQQYHTSQWPEDAISLEGKRVGVIGTAATGIQVIQSIAPIVSHLTVFQRTPNYAVAMKNPALNQDDMKWMHGAYDDFRTSVFDSNGGFNFDIDEPPLFSEVPEDERVARLETLWSAGDLRMWGATFADTLFNPEAAEYVSEFVRSKMRARVNDPVVAEKLMPKDYYFGTRRVPLENGYFEVFNRDNVDLVDLHEEPISHFDERGIKTAAQDYDLDVVIYATGFDAAVGAIYQVDIRGVGGESLRDSWKQRLRTTVGMQVHGFPNLFMTMAPFAPAAAICNFPVCSDQQCDWIAETIGFVRQNQHQSIQPTAETENAWMDTHEAFAEISLMSQNTNSWYSHQNGDGTKAVLGFLGGIQEYRRVCNEMTSGGYQGFDLT